MSKIKKILIANRGEIACRVIKTARKMGIKTVAVYSDADAKALHVRMADEAVHIGASPAAESYLVIDKIIDACKDTGADAVHPGYGFLSENPDFARALKKAKITFIGPAAESMEAMGLKDAAKALMMEAGVPVTPGYQGDNQDPKHLKKEADKIGYPVLIKAVAGGGGKGMRKVEDSEDFLDALSSCQREAKSSFGNDIVLIEKYISSPRHIEVQVFGDTHGNVIHLFERDCSLQRRHQKVIEEAPAPGMTDSVRAAMTEAAVNAAKAVNYVGAGTVEFIVDGSGELKEDGFWFMEMNTRLQVEHPVTEMITGLDLVELQIRVAQGEKLPPQKDISISGHAIEARLYAEDPSNDFLPSIGKLEKFYVSSFTYEDDAEIRIDTGVSEKDTISVFYDPMIAKVICYADDRSTAISEISDCLGGASILGVKNNTLFLESLVSNSKFKDCELSTSFISENFDPAGLNATEINPIIFGIATCQLLKDIKHNIWRRHNFSHSFENPFEKQDGWRANLSPDSGYYFTYENQEFYVAVKEILEDRWIVKVNDQEFLIINEGNKTKSINFLKNWSFSQEGNLIELSHSDNPKAWQISLLDYSAKGLSAVAANALTAPMPGKIISVEVAPGAEVKAGDKLIVMEAMKMEMSLDAPRDGVVAAIPVEAGQLVNDGDILLELEKDE